MKIESWLFLGGTFFFLPIAVVYGFMTEWGEWVGIPGLFMLVALSLMLGGYLMFTAKRIGPRPEDRNDGEIQENAGVVGAFSPWSWWPIVVAGAAAIAFLGMAIGWWILYIGAGLSVIAIIGWTYEYSRGDHAH
ncbi:cytochrome c oxidase subunit 4 [Zhihengliuella halotolerans]|uniref:cytochrome c oxidase subunit 4 n=1 Tax=Zhihengliuella halotolerans TaxID=370736 RepID=UPI000C7FB710|nr:cytochrome c oxidase subunit 4 [Zhihengliuella halotolerans]MCO1340080.1 cytochrome C oxidase subunit IV [Kocuria polaris]